MRWVCPRLLNVARLLVTGHPAVRLIVLTLALAGFTGCSLQPPPTTQDNRAAVLKAQQGDTDLDDKVAVLIARLGDRNPSVREDAAIKLANLKDRRALRPMTIALRDQDFSVRWRASSYFADVAGPADTDLVEPLIYSLINLDSFVQKNAALALGEIKDPRAVAPLIEVAKTRFEFGRLQTHGNEPYYMGLP
jgi:hypothetical protein